MTIQHWTDDKVDYAFFYQPGHRRVEARLEYEDVVDNRGKSIVSYKIYARNPGVKDWLLVSTVKEPTVISASLRQDRIRSLVRLFLDDLPKLP